MLLCGTVYCYNVLDKCGGRVCCEPLAVNPWPVKMGKSCACERAWGYMWKGNKLRTLDKACCIIDLQLLN